MIFLKHWFKEIKMVEYEVQNRSKKSLDWEYRRKRHSRVGSRRLFWSLKTLKSVETLNSSRTIFKPREWSQIKGITHEKIGEEIYTLNPENRLLNSYPNPVFVEVTKKQRIDVFWK